MSEYTATVNDIVRKFGILKKNIFLEEKMRKISELRIASTNPDLWKDNDKAISVLQNLSDLSSEVKEFENLEEDIKTLQYLSKDDSSNLDKDINEITKRIEKLELNAFLSGEFDQGNAILSIHAGQGGTEANDFVSMLTRMYLKYSEGKGWKVSLPEETRGEEAGIKSVTLLILGRFAYGYLKNEAGTHRLVRKSPFNADNLRQTSFALVEVLPQLPLTEKIEIRDDDLEWQFFRSSSQGGQNVQKVSTAVRLIHKPTGITVTAQSERFQEQNRKIALNLLRSKLWVRLRQDEKETKDKLKGEYRPASWGNQIRSYVLHPYKMIKDLRTGVETSNTEAVLDGKLDDFIQAEIKI